MSNTLWQRCLGLLRERFSQQDFNACIRPLQVEEKDNLLILLAPNRFVVNWIQEEFLGTIKSIVSELSVNRSLQVIIKIGSNRRPLVTEIGINGNNNQKSVDKIVGKEISSWRSNLNHVYVFDNFVEGNSNQIALAAAKQISENPGGAYNPLFLYGGVGLGKTHLMHAVGNEALTIKGNHLKVLYLHSERFVAEMVKSLQTNTINRFKEFYRSVDILLIDDIQFLAGKDRSQEEFFHTFNSLIESHKQIILTCDRYPKEVSGLEERLKSRFGWGLTVAVEPPELETRVAILMNKAESQVDLPYEVAFFIAKRIRSNIRELEGVLKRVIASSQFTGQPITVDFVKKSLKDLLSLQDRLVTIGNIQKTVAGYYKIKLADLLSKRRNRSYARPRQIAMALAKELTNHSLPEIGENFGGRDHTTVLHACRKVKLLREQDADIREDYMNLLRILST